MTIKQVQTKIHIVLVGALPESLNNFRGDLIRALITSGHRVTAMAAPANAETVSCLESMGARFRPFPVQRNVLSPLRDVQTLLALRTAFLELKPDAVLAYTVKPVIWGGLALFGMPGIRFYALIEGLGFAFQGKGFVRKGLAWLVTWLYRIALHRASSVIFLNPDNRGAFLTRRILSQEKCLLIDGIGLDILHFAVSDMPKTGTIFLLIARLLGDKGIRDYVAAARRVRHLYPDAVFQILGSPDSSPDAIALAEVQSWQDEGVIQYFGETADVRPFIAGCHVYVLPSYHEGMPRTVMEAMAMGRPILTTNVPGCRETVAPGENGFLVPKADPAALAERMIWFIENRDQWQRMGQASRRMTEERFDVHKINAQMLRIMGLTAESGAI